MNSYDKAKVGKLLVLGADHTVYEYGPDKVLKHSVLFWLLGKDGREKAVHDYDTCKKYLGEYLLETEIASSPDGKGTVHIQPKISGHSLSEDDMKDSTLRAQFLEFMARYAQMIQDGNPHLDLIGKGGAVEARLSNILVTDGKLRLYDATALSVKEGNLWGPLITMLRKGVLWRQRIVVARLMNAAGVPSSAIV